jgi:hypothetical protein
MVVHLDRLEIYQKNFRALMREQQELLESDHRKNQVPGEGRPGQSQTSEAQRPGKNKWRYACRILGTDSLKEEALWRINQLLGNDRQIIKYRAAVTK